VRDFYCSLCLAILVQPCWLDEDQEEKVQEIVYS
jgi:hypothetical protein